MKKIIILLLLSMALLSGCSSVSKKDYDDLKSDYEKLNTDYQSLDNDYDDLTDSYNSLLKENSDNEKSYKEYFDLYSNLYVESASDEIMGAWGKTAFGDETQYSNVGKNTIQFIVKMKKVSADSVTDFYDSLLDNVSSLALLSVANQNYLIFIKAVDSNGYPVLEIFLDRTHDDSSDIDILIANKYKDIVVNSLSDVSKK